MGPSGIVRWKQRSRTRFSKQLCDSDVPRNTEKRGATVYVHTSALPEWVEAKKRFATVDSWITHKNGMKQVIETIRNFDDWKALEWKVGKVAECVTISKNSTRKHLKTLAEQGYLDKRTAGRGGAFHFSNVRLEEAQKYGHVEFAE